MNTDSASNVKTFDDLMEQFEIWKGNEGKAQNDIKILKANYLPFEEAIVKYMEQQNKKWLVHKNTKTGCYYKYVLPEPKKNSAKMPKREDYLRWLRDNWRQVTSNIEDLSAEAFYQRFIELPSKFNAEKTASKNENVTKKQLRHIILHEITSSEWESLLCKSKIRAAEEAASNTVDIFSPKPSPSMNNTLSYKTSMDDDDDD